MKRQPDSARKRRRKNEPVHSPSRERAIAAEQLLIDIISELSGSRVLCTSLGRGQLAAAIAAQRAGACRPDESPRVVCHFLDIYLADQAREFLGAGQGGVEVRCAADFHNEEFDLVAIPVHERGDAELTRDILQAGHLALALGGRLAASTRNREDQWLQTELKKLFPKVTRRVVDQGTIYLATKTAPLKKVKDFTCEFAFRDRERLIHAVSRPGVFSHRSLDGGARALLNAMEIQPGDRVLDIGCGSGAVALAAALRAENVAVVAVDSHARSVECTERGAALNGLTNVSTLLNAEGECGMPGTFDIALGNPPYYSDFRIAEIFLQAARRALKPRGRVLMVTKHAGWFEERMGTLFEDVQCVPQKAYTVVQARKTT